jgi:hypothetical protein
MSRSGWLAEQKSDSSRFFYRRHAAMEREDGPEEHGCGPDREGTQKSSGADKAFGKEGQAAPDIESQEGDCKDEDDCKDADETRPAAQSGCQDVASLTSAVHRCRSACIFQVEVAPHTEDVDVVEERVH